MKPKKSWHIIAPLIIEGQKVGSLTRTVSAYTRSEARAEAKREFAGTGFLGTKSRLPAETMIRRAHDHQS